MLSETEVAAIVVVVGHVLMLARTWVRERARVQMERQRGAVRRDIIRALPPGSRVREASDGTMIDVGHVEGRSNQGDAACG
ncbi:hypothetical protein EASAB2608_03733 [Streptomyces sp. EAS-AB2608]|nr:hypothetical protein EASAB2608_03733 [Streptomyces sp. EAS-AB2608]